MEKDNKILVYALIIILVISFLSYTFSDITGKAVKIKDTTIKIDPNKIKAGNYLNMYIDAGTKGISKKYKICEENGLCRARANLNCGSFTCRKDFIDRYKTYSSWENGTYYMKFFDYNVNDYIKVYFEIIG